MSPEAYFSVEVGCVLWRQIRHLVAEAQMRGYKVECKEGRGWLSRMFYVSGDQRVVKAIHDAMRAIS